jgi:ABC-type transport system involved in multi-copper enzyme maturation permease subunit
MRYNKRKSGNPTLMASQKLTNCCVAAIALVTAAYLSTPHSSTIARLTFGAFCLAIHSFCFLAKASTLMHSQIRFVMPE